MSASSALRPSAHRLWFDQMAKTSTTWVTLIRAVGPATHKLMSMAQLRAACENAGLEDVRTVLATGNVIFSSAKSAPQVKRTLDQVIAAHQLNNEVFLRQPEDLKTVLEANPFPDAALERPNHMLVLFMESAPSADAGSVLAGHPGPERVQVSGREVFVNYVEGVEQKRNSQQFGCAFM